MRDRVHITIRQARYRYKHMADFIIIMEVWRKRGVAKSWRMRIIVCLTGFDTGQYSRVCKQVVFNSAC